jgi:hypothetical protein
MYSLNKGLTQEHYKLTKYEMEKERKGYSDIVKDIINKRSKK